MALDMSHDTEKIMECSPTVESVVYRPRDEAQRTIEAEIDRNPPILPAEAPGPGRAVNNMIVVVSNDGTTGIAATELQTGFDVLEIPLRVGGLETEQRRIGSLISQDNGALTLGVI